jgi:hypothetical protein
MSYAALQALCALIRQASPPPALDAARWDAVLRLANAHLLAPSLYAALGGTWRLELVPEEVGDYLSFLYRLNGERNDALRAQAVELVDALNADGVAPMLLKGGIALFDDPYGDPAARMIGDLDVMVPAGQLGQALVALRRLGYGEIAVYDAGHNAYGELARDGSPAAIDLHLRPIDAPHLLGAGKLWRDAVPLHVPRLRALVPSPTHRVLHTLLHAQIHHLGGYYRGGLRLNQLYDLVALAQHFGAQVDWRAIAVRHAAHRLDSALHSYLLAAERLFGLAWPLRALPTAAARLHHARAMAQLAWPALDRLAGPWGNLRGAFAWHRMRALYGDVPGRMPWRLRHLLQFIAKRPPQAGIIRLFRAH